jgi:hypothetical protein
MVSQFLVSTAILAPRTRAWVKHSSNTNHYLKRGCPI